MKPDKTIFFLMLNLIFFLRKNEKVCGSPSHFFFFDFKLSLRIKNKEQAAAHIRQHRDEFVDTLRVTTKRPNCIKLFNIVTDCDAGAADVLREEMKSSVKLDRVRAMDKPTQLREMVRSTLKEYNYVKKKDRPVQESIKKGE